MLKQDLSHGTLYITEEVLSIITSICINEFSGISVYTTKFGPEIIQKITSNFNKNNIVIKQNENEIVIEVKVSISFGLNVIQSCENLQELIVNEIEEITGLHVTSVHIIIEDINTVA
ncbi:Asp23/Gls24 family envelope stress response protein [Litchfieldia alkalitelluris]|uniref:Asp23/Gls24 family envelope stress response protein n=1 Tax=Litchfieldia alkalitelluris TaxID=304268 RepID=UPI0014749B91|nr:Asp23/Gls24 family envelope stress response protein [Litchfieldia alkalitelluris]